MTADAATLDTDRLRLRRPIEQDADDIVAIAGDWEVARRLARVPHPYAHSDFRYFLDEVVVREPTWSIVHRPTGRVVGVVGLAPNADRSSAELGYYIARDQWGRGIATEAGRAIVQHGLGTLGYRGLTSGYHADNSASGRVLSKLGFVVVRRAVRPCLAENGSKESVEVELRPALRGG